MIPLETNGPLEFFDLTFPEVTDNLACDEAVLVLAEESSGSPVVRFWELDHPAVILGASCRMAENVLVEACMADGIPIARRSSGGGTVVIGPGALNVTVVLPIAHEPSAFRSVDTAQRFVLEKIAEGLRAEVSAVAMLGSGDLTIHGRKFSGSAQRRLRHHLMIHASILYDFDLDRIDRYTKMPARQPSYREGRPHSDFLVNLPMKRSKIVEAIRSVWGPMENYEVPFELVDELARRKFKDFGWIERL